MASPKKFDTFGGAFKAEATLDIYISFFIYLVFYTDVAFLISRFDPSEIH